MEAAGQTVEPATVIDYSCITEPYTQLWALRGVPILDPQNFAGRHRGSPADSAAGLVDATCEPS